MPPPLTKRVPGPCTDSPGRCQTKIMVRRARMGLTKSDVRCQWVLQRGAAVHRLWRLVCERPGRVAHLAYAGALRQRAHRAGNAKVLRDHALRVGPELHAPRDQRGGGILRHRMRARRRNLPVAPGDGRREASARRGGRGDRRLHRQEPQRPPRGGDRRRFQAGLDRARAVIGGRDVRRLAYPLEVPRGRWVPG